MGIHTYALFSIATLFLLFLPKIAVGDTWATVGKIWLLLKKSLLSALSKQLAILLLMDTYKHRYLELISRWKEYSVLQEQLRKDHPY